MSRTSHSSVAETALPATDTALLPRHGLAAALAAFIIWGMFPVYLKGLTTVSALQVTAHRVVWSCLFVLAWMGARGELGKLRDALARPGVFSRLTASAVLITVNWLVFVWAVNRDHVVEVSLGYYINPLVNVLLGIFVLSERLNRTQWIAVGLAAAAVSYLTFDTGRVPWVALTLAVSFGLYGLIRKTVPVEALPGLGIELLLLLPFAGGYLIWCEMAGIGALGHQGAAIDALLLVSGLVTALPLFLFSFGARLIPYSTIGVLQYIAPSLQLACGVLLFGEPFGHARAIGFTLIWAALLVYAADGVWRARTRRPSVGTA